MTTDRYAEVFYKAGSSIAFDYYDNSLIEGNNSSYGTKELVMPADNKGEMLRSSPLL